jgi:phosphoserine phosphatase
MSKWVYFDVDDTLLLWDSSQIRRMCGGSEVYDALPTIEVPNPYYTGAPYSGHFPVLSLKKHTKHLEDLKKHFDKGDTIVVWSAGGKEWAEAAVKALGIEHLVSHILQKPDTYYDDLHCKYFMPHSPRWRKGKE